ncbi:MAG: hypothetical protein Q7S58_05475 [Candidatus Binatus sp.]|uniref:hypothetical protein n=1 Tax=Candidatus Binatus sp. TaxID=2811406 RepID=UPI00271AE8E2|nr:hypothetical protein [Candidatus Binatus sp.]MDO8431845.1 hypothetical protein [Candidatus Binatus sp.]
MRRARFTVSIALPLATLAITIVVGGAASAQTMGEYASTTAMSTARKPAAAAMPEHRTWETNKWGGSFSDRVGKGSGGDFSSRASAGKGETSNESRWPGSSIGEMKTGDTKRFDSGERFKSDEKRFAGSERTRFGGDKDRFAPSRFHDNQGLDERYNSSGLDTRYSDH